MTISQALISINSFPIPVLFIEKVGIKRGLAITDEYTLEVDDSDNFKLATADVYFWLYGHINFSEQEFSASQQKEIKEGFFNIANSIYFEVGDPNFKGVEYGFIGENING